MSYKSDWAATYALAATGDRTYDGEWEGYAMMTSRGKTNHVGVCFNKDGRGFLWVNGFKRRLYETKETMPKDQEAWDRYLDWVLQELYGTTDGDIVLALEELGGGKNGYR